MSEKKKSIAWESWNSKVDEYLNPESLPDQGEDVFQSNYDESQIEGMPFGDFQISGPMSLHTPVGLYPIESMLKPSDRWDCWFGYTNFPITHRIKQILNDEIEGIEALKICGKYTFFIGVGKMFDISEVRKQVLSKICAYTEEELLANVDIEYTVELLKDQLSQNTHWSILVSPQGEIEYIVSNSIDSTYLNKLSRLIEKKNSYGGIILRSEDG